MRGHGFTIIALLLLVLAVPMALVNPMVALGITVCVLAAGIALLVARIKNL